MATREPYNPFRRDPAVATPTPPPTPTPAANGNGLAIAGMVLGIIGVVTFFIPWLGPILSILGLIFGILGVKRAGKVGGAGKGMAVAGVACGAVGIVVGGIVTAVVLNAFRDYADTYRRRDLDLPLRMVEKKVRALWVETQSLPPSSVTLPGAPGAACDEPGRTFAEVPYDVWNEDPGWRALDFQVYGTSRYSFRWTKKSETSGVIEAFADADCDGTISTTTSTVTVRGGSIFVERGRPSAD